MHIVYSSQHRHHPTTLALPGLDTAYLEVPERAEIILAAATAAGLGPVLPPDDHGLAPFLAVHEAAFVDFLRNAFTTHQLTQPGASLLLPDAYFAVRGQRYRPVHGTRLANYYAIDRDCPLLPGTWQAAYWSAQTALTAAELVRSGARSAYALCRPPGHHASADQYGGYCYLNNAAIAARFLQSAGYDRVAIVDVDVHHGNGTQEIFYADPSVLFCSLHVDPEVEYPYYWGGREELGAGAGHGCNRNWPLAPGLGDAGYLAALDEALAAVRDFAPEAVVISAGSDLMAGDPSVDPGGGLAITPDGLREIAARLAALALPTVIVQEGGYQLDRLGSYTVILLREFTEL
jgi:acetoin utilization deacetylase AcuC-like enzyme